MSAFRSVVTLTHNPEKGHKVMETKKCKSCGIEKPYSEFYRNSQPVGGLRGSCRKCLNEKSKAYIAVPHHKAIHMECRRRRLQTSEGKALHNQHTKRYKARHPDKYKAGYLLQNAINGGHIKRQPCEVCGNPKSEGHHSDYSQPLQVTWLCKLHHTQAHREVAI